MSREKEGLIAEIRELRRSLKSMPYGDVKWTIAINGFAISADDFLEDYQ